MSSRNAQRRVVDVWTWLPAFRAVAEVEHVQKAARALHVTASSLSRAIRLLEDHLETKLFERVGRNIRLNHHGETLLTAVRHGMRRIDDGIAEVTGSVFAGEIRVACDGDQPISFAWRAATRMREKHPAVRTTVEDAATDLPSRILRGEIDLAIVGAAPANPRLGVEQLGVVTYGVYCAKGHPLFAQERPTLEAITAQPFVAPTGDDERTGDRWPRELARVVVLRLPALEPAIAACASGQLLAVLPDIAVTNAKLRRLPLPEIAPSALYAVRRPSTGGVDLVAAFVDGLREEVRAVTGPPSRPRKAGAPSRARRT